MKVGNFKMTISACPTLWECTVDGQPAYIRFRWGYIALKLAQGRGLRNEEIIGEQISDDLDGTLDNADMIDWLAKQPNVEII